VKVSGQRSAVSGQESALWLWRNGGLNPKRCQATALQKAGFTMVEIALCLAVIGFALVAIVGVLPLGMQVQRDSREETIINNDGAILLEAIRDGRPLENLPFFVEEVRQVTWTDPLVTNVFKVLNESNIVGLLSNPEMLRGEAIVRSMNGPAADTGPDAQDLSFRYKLTCEIRPFNTLDPTFTTNNLLLEIHSNHVHEVRLTFRYPLLSADRTGTGRKVFRAVVSGRLQPYTNDVNEITWFFRPERFASGP
jgi:type II secretory pathway pseudopilin PulG